MQLGFAMLWEVAGDGVGKGERGEVGGAGLLELDVVQRLGWWNGGCGDALGRCGVGRGRFGLLLVSYLATKGPVGRTAGVQRGYVAAEVHLQSMFGSVNKKEHLSKS
jgi:hypothetical protein